jgi:hypothetical protein
MSGSGAGNARGNTGIKPSARLKSNSVLESVRCTPLPKAPDWESIIASFAAGTTSAITIRGRIKHWWLWVCADFWWAYYEIREAQYGEKAAARAQEFENYKAKLRMYSAPLTHAGFLWA